MSRLSTARPRSLELVGPVGALWIPRDIETLTAGITFAAGDIGMVDVAAASQTSDNFYAKAIESTTAGITRSIAASPVAAFFCVALEPIASGKTGKFQFYGAVSALIVGTPAVGTWMSATNASSGLTASVASQMIIATMKEVGVNGQKKKVFFDGINGFGMLVA